MTGGPAPGEKVARDRLRLYLSGDLPLEEMAGFLPSLAVGSAGAVAHEIRQWAQEQTGPTYFSDDLSLGVRRFLALQTRGAVDPERHGAFMREVAEAVRAQASPIEQERLARWVTPFLRGGQGAAEPSPNRAAVPAASPRRLTLILDRLDASPAAPGRGRPQEQLRGEAVLTAALAAESAEDLERNLGDLRDRGLVSGTAEILRVLVESLPPWPLPDLTARTAPAVAAIERVVSLAPDPEQVRRRVHDLVAAGVDAFNRGDLDRAGLVFGVVERFLDRKVVEAEMVEPLRARGHERLDLELLRRLLEGHDRREIPRAILRFFHVFDPEALLDKLRREPARQRRSLLLAFLEAHGGDGRTAAFERLARRPEDQHDVFLVRNLVHLLRRISDGDSPWMPERELARVIRLLVPDNPSFLVREVLAYLTEKRRGVAEQVLMLFVTTLEDVLLSPPAGAEDADHQHWKTLLDETCAALVRYGTPRTRAALVEHGLRTEPALGSTGARLVGLGAENLASQPELVRRLVDAARSALPRGFLAQLSSEQSERMGSLVAALGETRTAEVQELLETLAARLPDHDAGRRAAQILNAASAGDDSSGFTSPAAGVSLSGDLRVFGLPTLLQNMGDSRVTGVLSLLDEHGRRVATLEFGRGQVGDARFGNLIGPEVVYQLLERPFHGTFAFVPRAAASGEDPIARHEVTQLLLEGLRRHDELRRATVLVPDRACFETTERPPSALTEEDDIDLVTSLWEKAVAGHTPEQCEQVLAADAYRVRRCLAHWIEEGALRLDPVGRPDAES